ncbi:MAG: penicillin-binding protein activator [Gammaproteobacteria bacterium]|nr:MAG: penicillin-binding protein activator [Gammaproteobacteria bacterium]
MKNPLHNALFLIAIALLASACATTDGAGSQSERRAQRLADSGQHADAAALYVGLASAAAGPERDRLTLLAVEQWLDGGDGRRARNALRSVTPPADGELLWQWSADAAALALWEGRPDSAMALLEPLSRQPLGQRDRSRVEALRADAWFQKDDPAQAVVLYMQREIWLDDRRSIESNRRRLWEGLLVSDARMLREAAAVATDPVVAGWLSLGALATATGRQGIGWSNGVRRWQERHARHPALGILSDLHLADGGVLDYPGRIALLLPLSGKNAAAGKAVQNGFFGAYFSAAATLEDAQQIRVYDAAAAGGARTAYADAIAAGAEFVVGPLMRSNVAALAQDGLLPVPLLALNYLPDHILAPPGMYQFALAPEDEAVAAAQRAYADGARHAVALFPGNDWGRRVVAAFRAKFEALGGVLLDFRGYQPADQDFSLEIKDLMGLSQSLERYRRLRANIEHPLQFEPRRRQDVDMIFLAAGAKAGRLLKSQLKFHYSGDLQVYSTSFIYAMDRRSDSDLNGLMFADTPWIVAPPAWIADFPEIYARYWPGERRLGRLHAMGYDAYQLVAGLFSARDGTMDELIGATGRLTLASDGRIHRQLAWAQFQRGTPVALPESEPQLPDDQAMEWPPTLPNP